MLLTRCYEVDLIKVEICGVCGLHEICGVCGLHEICGVCGLHER